MTKLISILSFATLALAACAADPTPTVTGEHETVQAGPAGKALGIQSYEVTQGASATQIIARGSHGTVGSITTDQIGAGKRITVTGAGPAFTIEMYTDQVRVLENGEERGVYAQGTLPESFTKTPEIAPGVALLNAVGADNVLHDQLDAMRSKANPAGATAYMFGLTDCPGWVVVGACTAAPPVCAYCIIAWL